MEAGPDGRLLPAEYEQPWFQKNPDAGLSRIDYNANPTASVTPAVSVVADSSASAHGPYAAGYALTQVLDCKSCHKKTVHPFGPSFVCVSLKNMRTIKRPWLI